MAAAGAALGQPDPEGEQARARACQQMARSEWPTTPVARRALLQRMESVRSQCMEQAAFLASLGALWMDEGEPRQALIWLERALLLEPESLGAQADHALALAAMGEPAAVTELVNSWRTRSDVPLGLRQKLGLVAGDQPFSIPAGIPERTNGRWASHREASLLAGYESNLNFSPRLSEITLTPPDGPIALPLLTPLVPRRGVAVLGDLSWQVAHSPQPDQVWRTGVRIGARGAPGDGETDWHQVQWAASLHQRWGPWRGQLELGATWAGGQLSEPYSVLRLAVAGERDALGCRIRTALEVEARKPEATRVFAGDSTSALWSSQCAIPSLRGWVWGVALKGGVDQPEDDARPGGRQRLWSLGLRLTGPVGQLLPGTRFDANLRAGWIQDALGYSALLENNEARHQDQTQLSLQLSRPLSIDSLPGAEALLQWQAQRQASNLAVFRHSGNSLYAGMRWAW